MSERRRARKTILLLLLLLILSQTVALYGLALAEDLLLEQVRLELAGLEYLGPLRRLRELLPFHPDVRSGPILVDEPGIRDALAQLDRIDQQEGTKLGMTEDFVRLSNLWRQLEKTDSPEERADLRWQLAEQVRSMNSLVGDTSQLILDPEIDTYYLIDCAVNLLVQSEQTLTAVGNLQRADGGDPGSRRALLAEELRRILQETRRAYQVALDQERLAGSQLDRPVRIYEERLADLSRLLAQGTPAAQPLEERVERALAANFHLFDKTLPEIRSLLDLRRRTMERKRFGPISCLIALLVIGVGLGISSLARAEESWEAMHGKAADPLSEVQDRSSLPPFPTVWQENEQLKLLVGELTLENRRLREPSFDGEEHGP